MKYKLDAFRLLEEIEKKYGKQSVLNRKIIDGIAKSINVTSTWLTNDERFRESRGIYRIPTSEFLLEENKTTMQEAKIQAATAEIIEMHPEESRKEIKQTISKNSDSSVPVKFPGYVKFGFYNDLKKIINSNQFYPVFITGHTGNGKCHFYDQKIKFRVEKSVYEKYFKGN